MGSSHELIVDAVLEGKTIKVPRALTTASTLRVSIWRRLKELKDMEKELGGSSDLQKKQISITADGDFFIVKIIIPQSYKISFEIVEDSE